MRHSTKQKRSSKPREEQWQYSQSAFESMRAYKGRIFGLGEHIQRLCRSSKSLGLKIDIDRRKLKNRIALKFKRLKIKDAYIRVGIGEEGQVNIIIKEISPCPGKFYKNGVSIVTSSITRNCVNCLDPQIKCGDFLNGIFAKTEPNAVDSFDTLMLNQDGYVTECTVSNIFIIKDGIIYTPPCSSGVLFGITRDKILQIARNAGFKAEEHTLTRFELYNADEVFLTNTSIEIMPVVYVDKRMIGIGRPGKITNKIREMFQNMVNYGQGQKGINKRIR